MTLRLPAGLFCPLENALRLPAGYFCPLENALRLPAGYFCPLENALRLPAGYFCLLENALRLPAGHFCPLENALRLPAGYFCPLECHFYARRSLRGLPRALERLPGGTSKRSNVCNRGWSEATPSDIHPGPWVEPRRGSTMPRCSTPPGSGDGWSRNPRVSLRSTGG